MSENQDWTLGSDNTLPETMLDEEAIKKLKEDYEKSSQLSMKSALKAVEQYAKTVKNIMENPDTWASVSKGDKSGK